MKAKEGLGCDECRRRPRLSPLRGSSIFRTGSLVFQRLDLLYHLFERHGHETTAATAEARRRPSRKHPCKRSPTHRPQITTGVGREAREAAGCGKGHGAPTKKGGGAAKEKARECPSPLPAGSTPPGAPRTGLLPPPQVAAAAGVAPPHGAPETFSRAATAASDLAKQSLARRRRKAFSGV